MTKQERMTNLLTHLEWVVTIAHEMWKQDEMNDKEYGMFNGTIAQLEGLARELEA